MLLNSEPCQPCVFHNLPCLPLQSLCICETCGRCLDCLLLILTVPIPSWPESISRARSSSSDIDLPHSNYHTFFLLLSIPPRSLVPAFTRCKYSIYSANGCQSIQPPPFIQHRFLSITSFRQPSSDLAENILLYVHGFSLKPHWDHRHGAATGNVTPSPLPPFCVCSCRIWLVVAGLHRLLDYSSPVLLCITVNSSLGEPLLSHLSTTDHARHSF